MNRDRGRMRMLVPMIRFTFLMTLVLTLGAVVVSAGAASVEATCQKEHATEVKAAGKQRSQLLKTVMSHMQGAMVAAGPCTIRALRLGITIGDDRVNANARNIIEAADCFAIRLYEIEQECSCRAAGLSYNADVEDDIFAEYKKVRTLEKKLLKLGINNPLIKSYVSKLQLTKDCISQSSLITLQGIYGKLEALEP